MSDIENAEHSSELTSASLARKRARRLLRIVQWSAVGLFLFLLLGGAAGVFWLRSVTRAALPQLDGDLHLAGLSAPVTVRRDTHGVPHIEAANQQDLFFAQGYVTAQDRLWQMDAYRRNANGELAEVMGRSLVRHDVAQRVLEFRNTAKRVYDNLAADERARLDAYARGVNLFIAQHPDSMPPEFALLHYKPKPWTGIDSLSVGMMMIETLDSRFTTKLAREKITRRLHNPKLVANLYPVGSWRDHPPTGQIVDLEQPNSIPAAPQGDDDDEDEPTQTRFAPSADLHELRALLGLPDCDGCQPGSNNWVLSGQHTASGKPLLSNDMHLSLTVPNIWYMADLSAPGYHAAGVTLTGFPYVIAGHNEHVAWGFTALYADVQDLYVEKIQGNNYEGNDAQWHPLAIDHEVIRVRGGEDVPLDVRSTEHGPLLNPLLPSESRPIALKWTLYDPTLKSLPIYAMNVASNWAEFSAALAQWCWPTQNVVYSDDQGHIAYHAVGSIPIRPAGIADVPIEDSTHIWQGYIPYNDLPGALDPPSGFLATANARVTTDKSKYPLTDEWSDPYRIERIYKVLQGRNGLTPKAMLALQTDIYSEVDQEMGHRFAYAIDHTAGTDARLRKAADLLRSWDGRLAVDSAAASIVTSARAALRPMLLEPKLGDLAKDYEWSESNFALEEIVMHANPDWLPPGFKDWDAALTEAVRRGMERGKATADVSHWRYGSWHVIDLEHPLAGFLPVIGRVAGTGPQPLSGDTVTVKQVGRAFGPSQRFTMDWSNIDGSSENIVLGESGNPFSPYFRDQWNAYSNGRTFALPFSPAAVAAQTQHTLRLLP
jgi:penicillin amidase